MPGGTGFLPSTVVILQKGYTLYLTSSLLAFMVEIM